MCLFYANESDGQFLNEREMKPRDLIPKLNWEKCGLKDRIPARVKASG